jgi:hypothetical protein
MNNSGSSPRKSSDFSQLSVSRGSDEQKLIPGGYKMPGRPPKIKRVRNPENQDKSARANTRVKDKKNKPYEPPTSYPDATPFSAWVEPVAEAIVKTNTARIKSEKNKEKGFGKK